MSKFFYIIILIFLFHGCKKNECEQTLQESIFKLGGPKNGFIKHDNVFIINAMGRNGCAKSIDLVSEQFENTIILKGNVHFIGCVCTQAFVSLSTQFIFSTSVPGIYTLKFLQQNGEYISDTITIQ